MIFNIVTPCTRIHNLSEIFHSIKKGSNHPNLAVNWFISFDCSVVKPTTNIKKIINYQLSWPNNIEIHTLYVINRKSVSGNAQRNEALDYIQEGFVYFLDDDNILHPKLVTTLLKLNAEKGSDIGLLHQQYVGNYTKVRTINNFSIKTGGIDIAQICVPSFWIKKLKWNLCSYNADGDFICTLYRNHSDRFIFENQPLAYYNKLQHRDASLAIKKCGGLGNMLQSGDLVTVNEPLLQQLKDSNPSKKERQNLNTVNRLTRTELEVLEVGDISTNQHYAKLAPLDNRHPAYKKGEGLAVFFETPELLHQLFTQQTIFGSEHGFDRKINIGPQWTSDKHRSGWEYAITALRCLHTRQGILFDGFIESNFSWDRSLNLSQGIIPYTQPWVGIVHNPHNMPRWFGDGHSSNQDIFGQREWQASLKHCRGLFTLSHYHKKFIKKRTGLPVEVLTHPTETPPKETHFTPNKYFSNKDKGLVQVGWWLRKPYSIHKLITNLKKYKLNPGNPWQHLMVTTDQPENVDTKSVKTIPWQTFGAYDDLLSKNIVFLDLYDSSANNAIIECIVRNTPMLVNPLDAVKEYLGEDYPFYFNTLEEASAKAENEQLIQDTYNYLVNHPTKPKLTKSYFLKSFAESSIYQNL